jgi:signal transduction histidine kinase
MSPLSPPLRKIRPLPHALRLILLQPLVSIPFALFFGTLFGATLHDYLVSYRMSLVFGYCIVPAIWTVRHFVQPRIESACLEEDDSIGWRIGASYIAASVVGAYVAATIIHFTIMPGFLGGVRQVVISGLFTLLFSALFTGYNFARVFYHEAVERARAVEKMRAELAQAELRALRAQIHPHFLFNTLNTIASLIAENPAAAEEMTTRLADVFRYTLRASEHELSRLGDELDFLRSYLEIERIRFGGRLAIEESIEPGLESALVPSLLLQPIVENAVRYGIAAHARGGTLGITARREGGRLALEITDDGPGMNGDQKPSGTGFGLHSVRERLRAAGHSDALRIDSTPGQGTRVRITVPLDVRAGAPPDSPGQSKGTPS